MKCIGCNEATESDGHGELVHEGTMKYGCAPGTKDKSVYPVAA